MCKQLKNASFIFSSFLYDLLGVLCGRLVMKALIIPSCLFSGILRSNMVKSYLKRKTYS